MNHFQKLPHQYYIQCLSSVRVQEWECWGLYGGLQISGWQIRPYTACEISLNPNGTASTPLLTTLLHLRDVGTYTTVPRDLQACTLGCAGRHPMIT